MRLFKLRKKWAYPVNIERKYNEISFTLKLLACFFMLAIVLVSLCLTKQTKPLLFSLIPLFYIFVYIFGIEIYKYANTPAMFVVNGLYFIRYFILPVLTFFDSRTMYLEENFYGILLLFYEEAITSFAFMIFLPKFKIKKHILNQRAKEIKNRFRFSKQLYLATFSVVCLTLLIIVANRGVLSDYNFIFSLNKDNIGNVDASELSAGSLESIIIDIARILVPATISLFFIKRYNYTGNKLNYYASIILGLFLSMCIIKGVDRGTVLLQGLAMVFFICYLAPEKKKKTLLVSFLILLFVGVYLISIRIFEKGNDDGISGIIDYIQSYVAGIKNQTIVWETYMKYSSSVKFSTVINDLFANVPFLSSLINSNNRCLKFFNLTFGRVGTDQVMPLIGNGILYFGVLFAPILNVIAIRLLLLCDTIFLDSKSAVMAIVWAYMASIMSFVHYQNVQLIMLYLTCRILPLFLVCSVFSKMKIKELE